MARVLPPEGPTPRTDWSAPSARPGPPPSTPQAPCRRCQLSGTQCVFEKPEKKNVQPMANTSIE